MSENPTAPADAWEAAFHAHKEGQTKFTRRMAINIADFFGVGPYDVVRLYERRGLLKQGSADWFRRNGGFTRANFDEVRQDRMKENSNAQS